MIEPLDLNLATRPFKNNTLLWTGYSLGLVLLIAFAVWNVTSYVEYRGRLAETKADLMGIDEQIADLDRRENQANRRLKQADYNVGMLTSQTVGANGVIEWKAFSWTGLFNRMATVQPWNVYLASVRPMFRSRSGGDARRAAQESGEDDGGVGIVVEGFAKSLEALLDFERSLFADRYFDQPEPKRHQPTDSGQIVFEMEFTYYPDGLPLKADDDTPAKTSDEEGSEQPQPEPEPEAVAAEPTNPEPAEAVAEPSDLTTGDDPNATESAGGDR